MKVTNDEPLDYIQSSGPTRAPTPSRKPPGGRWLALAVVGAAVGWGAISSFTGSESHHRGPISWPPSTALGPAASFPSAPAEYLYADEPTTPSYLITYGVRYNTTEGFVGPVDAAITRDQPGHYTVTLRNFAVVGGSIRVTAYGDSSTCSDVGSKVVGADEQIRIICSDLGAEVPWVYAGPFVVGSSTDSRFTVAIVGPTSPSGT
jgi:hypothetical protein